MLGLALSGVLPDIFLKNSLNMLQIMLYYNFYACSCACNFAANVSPPHPTPLWFPASHYLQSKCHNLVQEHDTVQQHFLLFISLLLEQ